jgi:hypothetical protein
VNTGKMSQDQVCHVELEPVARLGTLRERCSLPAHEASGPAIQRQGADDADEINVAGHIGCGSAALFPSGTAVFRYRLS